MPADAGPLPDSPPSGDTSRRALLTAAAELFAEQGYDRTTVRAIADRAGVNQALLFRYFGNKEAVFARVAAERALAVLHGGPQDELLPRTLRSILSPGPGPEHDLFESVLRSAGSSEATRAARDELATAFISAFTTHVVGDGGDPQGAALRAELLLGWLLGIHLLRNVLHTDAVAGAGPEAVTGHVTRAAAALLSR
ncbi:TetR family transcriptional regulator [Pseudonocardia nantongensis]|uniref:TetR/AcrR family transcriptional regulator n=1 Tax=Pseudonocardia nantongensis TaxID=1181885 RepID=UPI00397A3473